MNPIQEENAKPGSGDWWLTNPVSAGDREAQTYRTRAIEGYASLTSVTIGSAISFYVSTTASKFTMKIYRLGYYNGLGGRLMRDMGHYDGIDQPTPTADGTGLIDCGNWTPWRPQPLVIPPDWISGVYVAQLQELQTNKQSYIIFVVRDDTRTSDYLFQSNVTTFQAYNNWGGKSTYIYNSNGWTGDCADDAPAAIKVSFNRPYAVPGYADAAGGAGAGDFFTHNFGSPDYKSTCLSFEVSSAGWEYNMMRWLESQGYDVTYCTNIDVHQNPSLLLSHRAFLSAGHDEYWSREMRINVENARDQGVHLGFFSANSVYWQIRLEMSQVNNQLDRTMVAYKDQAQSDPSPASNDNYPYPTTTTTFQALGWPEDSLVGTSYHGAQSDSPLVIADASHWVCAGTDLMNGQALPGLVGYEFGFVFDPSASPQGLSIIAHSPITYPPDTTYTRTHKGPYGSNLDDWITPGASDMTMYTADSGAKVLSTGTVQWSWGLDDSTVPSLTRDARKSEAVQQMTRNILSRFAAGQNGEGAFYRTDGQGNMTQTGATQTGWRSTWRTIVPGKFSESPYTDLLFYDAVNGQGEFWSTDGQGGIARIGTTQTGWRNSWRTIVAGKFSESPYTDLLFYDAINGQGAFYRTDGQGHITQIGTTQSGWPSTWRMIVPGKFSDGPYTDLLLYDAINGQGAFYRTDGQGNITQTGTTQTGWRSTWHTIVPGKFSESPYTDLLFYDAVNGQGVNYNPVNGQGVFYRTDGQGHMTQIGTTQTDWRKTWRTIVPGKFSDGAYTDLLFYDAVNGQGEFWSTDGQGGIARIGTTQAGWRNTWQWTLSFQADPTGPLSELLFYDQCPGTP